MASKIGAQMMANSQAAYDRLDKIAAAVQVLADLCRAIGDGDQSATLDTVNADSFATFLHLIGDGVRDHCDSALMMNVPVAAPKASRTVRAQQQAAE